MAVAEARHEVSVSEPSSSARRSKGAKHGWSIYEQDLFAAKNAKKKVRFVMAVEIPHCTDEDGMVEGLVTRIDKFNIQIDNTIWLSKLFIVGTEIPS